MAEQTSERLEDCLIARRRAYPGGQLRVAINISGVREGFDDATQRWRAIEHIMPTDGVLQDAQALLGEFSLAVVAERDGLETQITQMEASHASQLESLETSHQIEKAQMEEARAAEIAELSETNAVALQAASTALSDMTEEKRLSDLATAQAEQARSSAVAERDALQARIDELTAPPPRRTVAAYRFKIALKRFPSLTGHQERTLRMDVDEGIAAAGGDLADRYAGASEFYRDDVDLNDFATAQALAHGMTIQDGQDLLDQVFDVADTVP